MITTIIWTQKQSQHQNLNSLSKSLWICSPSWIPWLRSFSHLLIVKIIQTNFISTILQPLLSNRPMTTSLKGYFFFLSLIISILILHFCFYIFFNWFYLVLIGVWSILLLLLFLCYLGFVCVFDKWVFWILPDFGVPYFLYSLRLYIYLSNFEFDDWSICFLL